VKVVNSLVENCFAVIQLLAEEAASMRLGDIAERLDLPKSGTHRLLSSLCDLGWVEQDPATGLYRLTLRIAILGQRFLIATKIPDLCRPVLDRLAGECHELVRMAVVEDDGLAWVAHVQGAEAGLIYQPAMTDKVTLHVTAAGKAWLATLPIEDAVRRVLAVGFGKPGEFGPSAIRSVEPLVQELERTRERGYGLAIEESEPGIVAIAAAITLRNGSVAGTVSVAGPIIRMARESHGALAALVQSAAQDLGTLWPLRARWQHAVPPAESVPARA
jgi:DNA-binding IclR family transcriptional regulator